MPKEFTLFIQWGDDMFRYTPMKLPKPPQANEKRLDVLDGGLNVKYVESLINDSQSPYMLNLNANDRGALTKRQGQAEFHEFNGGPVHALTYYKNKWVCAHSTKLSTWDGETETAVMTGLADSDGVFFVVADILLYLNGTNYIQWDGTTAKDVEGYIPTITLGRAPSGGGTAHEEWNLISSGFTDSFNGTSSDTAYTLSFDNLDDTPVTAKVFNSVTKAWEDKTEGVHFSVNRTTGVVTFNEAPGEGINNVRVTAYKTFSGVADRVKKCKYVAQYGGGSNDSRIFIAGSPDYPNVYRWTGLTGNTTDDYRYFPENSFNRIGNDFKYITGFAKFYALLIIFKEDSIFSIKYSYNSETGSSFPVQLLNSQVGCDMPGSIQIIANAPVWCHTQYGIYTMVQTWIENEKNIISMSGNINGATFRPGLLDEDFKDLVACSSVDFDGKYWLCVGSKVWVWDYELSPFINDGNENKYKWFPYDNINANCFYIHDRELYHGNRTTGRITKFITDWNDYGEPIYAVWKSKLFDFDYADWLKTVSEIWLKSRSGTNTIITIVFYDDNNEITETATLKSKSFSWSTFSWSEFSWAVYRFPLITKFKPKQKKISHWQIQISNNELNKNLSIMGLTVKYTLDTKVK